MKDQAKKPLVNYHSHTWRCKHAGGTEEEYIRRAIDAGYRVFGFADHSPWPYPGGFESGIRMRLEQVPDYLATLRALGEKYRGEIFVPVGLECEAFPAYFGWLRDFRAEHLDYVIAAVTALYQDRDTIPNMRIVMGHSLPMRHFHAFLEPYPA